MKWKNKIDWKLGDQGSGPSFLLISKAFISVRERKDFDMYSLNWERERGCCIEREYLLLHNCLFLASGQNIQKTSKSCMLRERRYKGSCGLWWSGPRRRHAWDSLWFLPVLWEITELPWGKVSPGAVKSSAPISVYHQQRTSACSWVT